MAANQALEQRVVTNAFRMFLGRAPAASAQFTDFDAMITALMQSPEFKQSRKSQKNTKIGWPEAQYFIAKNHKIMYCPIGKNACTFLKRMMVVVAEHPHETVINYSVHAMTDRVKTGMQLSDYGSPKVTEMTNDPDLFSFAVLRDPARRLLSAYVEKFFKNRMLHANLRFHTAPVIAAVQKGHGLDEPDFELGISFREFVEYVTSQKPEKLDPHWCPQHLYLGDHKWTKLYDFDNMAQLVHDLEERTGLTLDPAPTNTSGSGIGVPLENADQMLPEILDEAPMVAAESFLTDDLMDRIRDYFRKDYELMEPLIK